MFEFVLVILLVVAICITLFIFGYSYRAIQDDLAQLKAGLKPNEIPFNAKEEPKSVIVEALSPEEQAKKDFEERVKRLNP